MQPEVSLSHWQVSATCPCREPEVFSPYSHSTSWRFILILPSYLRLGLQVVSFPQVSTPKLCIHLSPPHTCYLPRSSLSSTFDHPNNIWWGVQIMKLPILSPLPCYLVALRPNVFPRYPVLKHPQPTFLTQSERPCFTSIQNKSQNCVFFFLYLNPYIFE